MILDSPLIVGLVVVIILENSLQLSASEYAYASPWAKLLNLLSFKETIFCFFSLAILMGLAHLSKFSDDSRT